MLRPLGILVGCLALVAASQLQPALAQGKVLFSENFQKPLGERWKPIRFHEPTDYRIVTESSNACLRAFAQGGCSALATRADVPAGADVTCSWRWKIDHCPKGGTDDRLAAFDHAARVFIVFDTFIGPPRTINYVWANNAPTNTTFNHPLSGRTKFIVIETGDTYAGAWLAERRNIRSDWNRLFGGEPMPKIVAVGVFTDSHYTHIPLTGWYEEIVLEENETGKPARPDNDEERR